MIWQWGQSYSSHRVESRESGRLLPIHPDRWREPLNRMQQKHGSISCYHSSEWQQGHAFSESGGQTVKKAIISIDYCWVCSQHTTKPEAEGQMLLGVEKRLPIVEITVPAKKKELPRSQWLESWDVFPIGLTPALTASMACWRGRGQTE